MKKIPGNFVKNLLPKELKGNTLAFDPLNGGWAYKCAIQEKGAFMLVHLSLALELARDSYHANKRGGTDDKPLTECMKAWFFMVGYTIIDFVVPVLRRKGDSAIALEILGEYKKFNPFFHQSEEAIGQFCHNFDRVARDLNYDIFQQTERKMIEDMKAAKNYQKDGGYDMYQEFLGILETLQGRYRFVEFFREFAKRVIRNPQEANKLYSPDKEALSADVLRGLIKTIRAQKRDDVADALEMAPENRSMLAAA